MRPDPAVIARLHAALSRELGDRVVATDAIRDQHGHGEGMPDAALPDLVAFPHSNEEVAALVAHCAEARVPIVPFGAGTSLEGHVMAIAGGVSIDLTQMNRVLEVNNEDLDCRVQAGVTRMQLNQEIRSTGLFFPIDPGADATLGGMAATRASGTNAVKYGTMRENVLGLTVVTADGKIRHTGGRARKSAAGYDLTRLFVGSEGTLGVVTELQLRLYGVPEAMSAAVCQFPDLPSAVSVVITAMQLGIPVARIELLDDVQMGACIQFSKLTGFEPLPTLFFEFHGSTAGVEEQAAQMRELCDDGGGSQFHWATRPEDRTELWKARHNAYYAALALQPGKKGFSTDACVPISRLADCILETKADIAEHGLVAPIVGHVGDGNFHAIVLFNPDDANERAAADAFSRRVAERAIRLGGTCTGEHGVGLHKLPYLAVEQADAIEPMQWVKHAFDPHNLMNPGKTVPVGL